MPNDLLLKFARMVKAIHEEDKEEILAAFSGLGIQVSNPEDKSTVHKIAVTMLDTRSVPGYIIDSFRNPMEILKQNAVTKMPPDLYFIVRTIQLLRGITFAFDLSFSLADQWAPLANRELQREKERLWRIKSSSKPDRTFSLA